MTPDPDTPAPAPRYPTVGFMFSHPAHVLALGLGSGLSRFAPGTLGTLWAWMVFVVLTPIIPSPAWGIVIVLGLALGCHICGTTARNMGVQDPGSVVWDEIVAFWLVLWLLTPATLVWQGVAFALFRFFDAVKPGPVGWADHLFHDVDPATDRKAWLKTGAGIMLDDLVAAACTLLLIALWRHF